MKLGPDSALRYSSVNVTTRVRLYVHIDSVNMFISAIKIIFKGIIGVGRLYIVCCVDSPVEILIASFLKYL